MVRVAADDRAGEHDHFLDGRDQRSERVGLGRVYSQLFVNFVTDEVLEEALEPR